MLAQLLSVLQERLAQTCQACGRDPQDVQILAVTKGVEIERIREAVGLGLLSLGENRLQEALPKITALPEARWHLIGHLQSNKTAKALSHFNVIESVDSLELFRRLERQAAELQKPLRVLIQIKISGEAAKTGLAAQELPQILECAEQAQWLKVQGLMGIAPYFTDSEQSRPIFASLRGLYEKEFLPFFRGRFPSEKPTLSMGMSHDFEAAVKEGSTQVRLGSALFGARKISAV